MEFARLFLELGSEIGVREIVFCGLRFDKLSSETCNHYVWIIGIRRRMAGHLGIDRNWLYIFILNKLCIAYAWLTNYTEITVIRVGDIDVLPYSLLKDRWRPFVSIGNKEKGRTR